MKNKVKLIYTHKSYLYLLGVLLLLLTTTFTASAQADSLYGLWVKRAPFGSKGSAEIKTSLTDEQGNVYLSGVFSGTLNFSDDICNPVMSSVSSSAKKALFFMKLDPAGKYQWHIVYEISQGIPDPSPDNFNATICDYKDGKLLLYGRLVYKGVMSTLGTKVTFNKLGSSNSTEYTKPTNSSSDTYFYFQFLHVINVADGSTKSFIDPFTAETHNLTARFQGDNIHTIHMGWDHIAYQNNNSQVSIFDSNGNQIGSNIAYPDQPYAAPGAPGCGSTIAKHVTLADGRQAMVHFSYDKVVPNVDIPSYYLLYYKGDYSKRDTMFLMSSRAIEYFPHITTDNSSNLYIATNYGKSEHWNTHVPFPNSNHLDNFLGSGKNFMTKPQTNKVVLARMNSDNTVKWIFQIGDNNDTDGRMIVANDMKTIGNRTYLVGQFMGGNLNFNGIELSNSGSTAPYWYWNWDVFYAVFDNETGACLYAVNMGNLNIDNAHNSDEGKTIYLSPDATHVLIGGTYDSPIFQSDPSNRLYPITSDGTNAHGFVAAYSTDYNSTPTPYASAFGDAPVSYGVVTNFAYPCLRLGELDFQKMQVEPAPSVDANTAQNDDAVILDTTANGYTNLSSANFTLLANGSLQAKVKVFNSIDEEAKLIGWIDFNRNGIFDENEASDLLIIPALSNSTTRTLTWTSASGRIRNGETYLRVRLSTDNLLPSTPSGLLFTGDVEDYKLNFNILSVEKTAVSDNSYDNGRAIIGDTITYSISIKNNSPIEMQVSGLYDPIPDSTVYITGSASPTGTLGAVTIGSESVNAISWPAVTIPAAGMANYSFKVALRAIPKADSVINNIAYVLLNNDTIPSTGTNCYLAPIIVDSLIVTDDYAQTIKNKPVVIPVLENDVVDCNFSGDAITSGLNGTAVWNSTYDSITYTPNADFVGIDSFTYTIKCGDGSGTATVYVAVVDLPDNIVDFDCVDEPTGFSWSFQSLGNSTQTVATHSPILAGDMDNDGRIEVVTLGTGNGYGTIKLIYIFDDELKVKYTINFAPAVNPIASSMAIADVDRDGYAELYICAEDGYLYKYIHNKQAYDGANYVYDNKAQFTTDLRYVGATPIITDFNGDGFPEISVLDKVFDAATLALLVDGQQLGTGDLGFGAGHAITATGNNKLPSIMAVGDVDGDGLPELVAGSTVYKIKINSRTNQSENSFTVYKQADKTGRTDVGDGATALADMDLDGKLDVIVTRRISSSAGAVYVWNPRTGEIMNTNSISNLSVYPASGQFGPFGPSMPFVGDIDGDKKPEVVVVANNMVRAYDFDNGTLTDKWNISTTDYSASTAITLFDFDQDGNAELIYRDCNNLRVLNGLDGSNKIAPYKCGSSTGQEYPIVVDLNQDGAAEIIVTGDLNGNSDAAIGYLRVFGSNPQGNWAPARKVWNQYPYNAVNVNDDLTIPKLQLNPATVFPGKDGEYGTADDVYPYNAYLQQQTFLNANGVPVFTLPDLQWTSTNPAFNYYGVGDSLVITVEVKNDGDAAIGAPVYFTAYKDAVALANVLAGGTYNNQIMPDSTISFSFRIDSLMTKYSPINQIIVRLNDSVNKYPYQQECITSDSIRSKNISDLLMAISDTASTIYNTPVIIDVLANDFLAACTKGSTDLLFELIPNTGLNNGDFIKNADSTFTYNPTTGFYGIDSTDYFIQCNADSSAARVYFLVTKPLSLSYYACPSQHPDDVVKIGFHKITGVTYNWYTVATGGTKLATTDSSYNVIKDNSAAQTWWAEPVYNGIVFPRIEINLYLADGCGEKNPVGCAVDGTILFREDFGGNSPEDPANKPEGIPQVVGLTYEPDALANNSLGGYTIAKRNITGPHTMWSKALIDDHTYPNDVTRGYLLMADAANIGNQFYKTTIKNLCEGTNLYFSAWASSVISFYAWTMDTPNFLFTLESNGVVIASYNTGDIPNNDLAWKQYGFNFTVPSGVDSLVLRIINNGRGGNGNDFVLDDIEIRLCAPPVTITPPVLVCPRDSFMLTGTYTDSPVTFGDDLVYFWEYSQTGDINEPSEWVTWGTGGTSSNGSINVTEGDIATTEREGYYRLVVGKASTINSSSCRASSEPVYIGLHKTILHYPDVRVQVCPTPDRQLNLNQYIDTVDLVKVDWTRIGVASPILNGDGHSINTGGMLAPTVYAYKYTAENTCLSQSGTVYLTALSDETRHLPPDTVQVCYEVADALLLNQLLGVEAGGTWVYDNTVNPDNVAASFVTESVLPSVSAGAVTFNGKSAWGVLGAAYDYTFRSVPGKKVVFKYRTPSTSCLGETEKTMVIILTDVVQ